MSAAPENASATPPSAISSTFGEPAVAGELAHTYGSFAADVLALDPDPVTAQVRYAFEHEWAVTLEDVARRRTTRALRGLDTPDARA